MIYPFSIILGALTENHYFLGNHYFCGNQFYFGGILLLVQFVNAFVQTLKKKKNFDDLRCHNQLVGVQIKFHFSMEHF